MSSRLRIAIIGDFPQERWESMDLVRDMIIQHMRQAPSQNLDSVLITPQYRTIFGKFSRSRLAWNLDRLINRRFVLPLGIMRAMKSGRYDTALVIDHSYAHIVRVIRSHHIPVVVICHDLDALTALIHPAKGFRAWLRRRFAKPIETGLLTSDHIVTVSETVRLDFLRYYGLRFPSDHVTTIPNGIPDEFTSRPNPNQPWPVHGLEDDPQHRPILLHVGSVIPRKRIDILLETVALLRENHPHLQLVRVGGPLNESQQKLADHLGLVPVIHSMPRLSRAELAELYRQSDILLVTSDAEGFGLPIVEALACGAVVVASDIPVLRETGGGFAHFAKPGDPASFAQISHALLTRNAANQADSQEMTQSLQHHLGRYRWDQNVENLSMIFHAMIKAE